MISPIREHHLDFNEYSKKLPKDQVHFLLNNNMKDKYLGACLDSCRWGRESSIMYDMSIKDMISFVQNWMNQNKDNLESLFHNNFEEFSKEIILPYKNNEKCTIENHKGTIEDIAGRIRCSYSKEEDNVLEVCYSIISEKNMLFSLEEVIKRLNKAPEFKNIYCSSITECNDQTGFCRGHKEENKQIEFNMDGWVLSAYIKKWYEQKSTPLFNKDIIIL